MPEPIPTPEEFAESLVNPICAYGEGCVDAGLADAAALIRARDAAVRAAALSECRVALCMVAVKLAREVHAEKRDNLIDICGWARVAEMCEPPIPPKF